MLCLTVGDVTLGDSFLLAHMESTDLLLFVPFEEGHAELTHIFGVVKYELKVSTIKFHHHLGVRDVQLI